MVNNIIRSTQSNIVSLNDDIMTYICSFILDASFSISETCKQFNQLLKDETRKIKIQGPNIEDVLQSIHTIQWAKNHKSFKYTYKAADTATKLNKQRVVKYIIKDGCPLTTNVYKYAIINKNIKLLRWFSKIRLPFAESVFNTAAKVGDIEIMKWLMKKNCPVSAATCNIAAKYGKYQALKYLIEHDCPWNEGTFVFAVQTPNIKIIKYLYKLASHDLSMPWWNFRVCTEAAKYGHLHILKWLREKQCPWNESVVYYAVKNQHQDLLNWAIKNGCPSYIN